MPSTNSSAKSWSAPRRVLEVAVLMLFAAVSAAPAAPGDNDRLDMYRVVLDPGTVGELIRRGIDVTAQRDLLDGQIEVDLVLTHKQRNDLATSGIDATPIRINGVLTVKEFAEAQAVAGFTVWRDNDGASGFDAYARRVARENPQLIKLVTIGRTHQGRDILALKLTQSARTVPDGSRPAVLYSSLQHAREWIAGETNRRLLDWFVARWRANDREVKTILKANELWFVLVANPDGYQYTFDHERLWRKNLRDNDGNGQITIADGVDPNRNFPEHFNYDGEGSAGIFTDPTYRGPSAGSEPETQALMGLMTRVRFAFHVNYHAYGPYLLYPAGWQIGTPTADDPIYFALSGNLDNPAIPGTWPGLSPDVLYVANGETTDWAQTTGALAWTPELDEGCAGCGFVFPDDEVLVEQEFQKNRPFALSLARSVADPSRPNSALGLTTKPFHLRSEDPFKSGTPGANFMFARSYGDPQVVATLARKSLGAVTLRWRVNGGAVQSAPTSEWAGGEVFDSGSQRYYHQVRGQVTGTNPGDSVEVWFTGGGQTSESFTYQAVAESGRRVLVVAAEDYTGAAPVQTTGPNHAGTYVTALAANGIAADVYDVDANGRTAPDALGVLSHYDAVVWETGDDIITRQSGWSAGNASRLALDIALEIRAYLNEGGRVLLAGKRASSQYASSVTGAQFYDPQGGSVSCLPPSSVSYRCLRLGGSGDGTNDVLQYWFGASLVNPLAGTNPGGGIFPIDGTGVPFSGVSWGFAPAATENASFITTSGLLPASEYPQFSSTAAARFDRPGGPFEPHSGTTYLYSNIGDASYKRLTKTLRIPAGGGNLSFWTSYITEVNWDYLVVEAHHPGSDDWTTLPDVNGHTSTSTGASCPGGWRSLHPQLDHYQTPANGGCLATGTTGSWNAATGSSDGWQQWSIDLSAYAGEDVEVAISYISDGSSQRVGVFVDDITAPDGTSTSFETGFDGWTVAGPPATSGPNVNDWTRTGSQGFPEAAVVRTDRSLLLGFGLEDVDTDANRVLIMDRVLDDLLP